MASSFTWVYILRETVLPVVGQGIVGGKGNLYPIADAVDIQNYEVGALYASFPVKSAIIICLAALIY